LTSSIYISRISSNPYTQHVPIILQAHLPLLLIGAGLANTSLAQTLRLTGYYNPTQVRIFDKFKSTTSPSYSWTAHDWATDKLDELTGKGQTSFFSSTVVDGDVGGTGVVEDRLMELTTGEPLGDVRIRGKEGEKSMRVGRGSVRNMLNQGLEIEFERTFERFERVRDEDGVSRSLCFKVQTARDLTCFVLGVAAAERGDPSVL
jgi:hypothetical protein